MSEIHARPRLPSKKRRKKGRSRSSDSCCVCNALIPVHAPISQDTYIRVSNPPPAQPQLTSVSPRSPGSVCFGKRKTPPCGVRKAARARKTAADVRGGWEQVAGWAGSHRAAQVVTARCHWMALSSYTLPASHAAPGDRVLSVPRLQGPCPGWLGRRCPTDW